MVFPDGLPGMSPLAFTTPLCCVLVTLSLLLHPLLHLLWVETALRGLPHPGTLPSAPSRGSAGRRLRAGLDRAGRWVSSASPHWAAVLTATAILNTHSRYPIPPHPIPWLKHRPGSPYTAPHLTPSGLVPVDSISLPSSIPLTQPHC